MAGSRQRAPLVTVARRRGRRTVTVTGLLLVALSMAACGDPADGQTGDASARGNGRPTPSAATLSSLLVQPSALPAGFRASSGQSTGYRFTLCGVDLEPTPPVDQVSARFAKSEVGPFIEQRVRRYPDDSQRDVIEALRAALATCRTTQATEPGAAQGTTMSVAPLELPTFAEQSVAWHQVSPSSPAAVPTDVVLMRRGRTIVLVTSYTFERTTDAGVVAVAAQAAADLLTSANDAAMGSAS